LLLSSVSGVDLRVTDCAADDGAGASAVSRTTAVPYPTRSTMSLSAAQSAAVLQVSAVVESTSATVPDVPDMFVVPVACVGGRSVVPPVPALSPIRYVSPAAIELLRFVTLHWDEPDGLPDRYCTDQLPRFCADDPRLASSMKSFL
jgi:hypothetical protein